MIMTQDKGVSMMVTRVVFARSNIKLCVLYMRNKIFTNFKLNHPDHKLMMIMLISMRINNDGDDHKDGDKGDVCQQ